MSLRLTLPRWYDLHAHIRQGEIMAPLLADHYAMGCAGLLAMPNTQPPVARVFEEEAAGLANAQGEAAWSIEAYRDMMMRAGGSRFDVLITPLYLTPATTPQMIAKGAAGGLLQACKYYPPHGTTNAQYGAKLALYHENGVLRAMEEHGVVLCVHGEAHDTNGAAYFDRETNAEIAFYRHMLPAIAAAYPALKIVCEHVTTKTAVDFVRSARTGIAATITPQHLLYTVADLLRGLKYHLYCLPLLKFDADRDALRAAVLAPDNTKFFAGTDSAPHAAKVTDCGCAAGCYTGGIAPQLYAQAFEEAGVDLADAANAKAFEAFLCRNGAVFYGLDIPEARFALVKTPQSIRPLQAGRQTILPLPLGLKPGADDATIPWSVAL